MTTTSSVPSALPASDLETLLKRAKSEGWTVLVLLGPACPANVWQHLATDQQLEVHEDQVAKVQFLDVAHARRIADIKSLRSLSLKGLSIRDDVFKELAHLTSLTSLDLWFNSLGDESADALAKMKALRHLDLTNNPLGPTAASAIGSLIQLQSLTLRLSSITNAGALRLQELRNLVHLDVIGCNLTNSVGTMLSKMLLMRRLWMSFNNIACTQQLISSLDAMQDLAELELRGNPKLGLYDDVIRSDRPRVIIDRLRAHIAHLQRDTAQSARPWRDVKVALLGDGEVGKSTLRWRIAPLPGEGPPDSGYHGRTRAWEARELELGDVQKRVKRKRRIRPSPLTVRLIDFGGQPFLWGAHRLFLSARRSIYVVVARCDKLLDGPRNRVHHWIKLIDAVREECVRAWMEVRKLDASHGYDNLSQPNLRGEAERRFPLLPIVVVLTHCRSLSADSIEQMQSRVHTMNARLRTRGVVSILVDIGPNIRDGSARSDVGVVRAAIERTIAQHPAFHAMWQAAGEPPAFFTLKDRLMDLFGDPAVTQSAVPWVTLEQYDAEIASGIDAALAREYMLELRDVGVLHYIGDMTRVSSRVNGVKELLFNPMWVRSPVYAVLWERMTQGVTKGVYSETDILSRIRSSFAAPPPPGLQIDPAIAILELMQACELIFYADVSVNGERLWVVPDQLDDESELEPLRGQVQASWELEFVPDSTMPRLIGRLWKDRRGVPSRHRLGLQTGEARGELVHVGRRIVLSVDGGTDAEQHMLLGIVRAAIATAILNPPEPRVEYWRRENGDRKAIKDDTKQVDHSGTMAIMNWLRRESSKLRMRQDGESTDGVRRRVARIEELLRTSDEVGVAGKQRVAIVMLGIYWYLEKWEEPHSRLYVSEKLCESAKVWFLAMGDDQVAATLGHSDEFNKEELARWQSKSIQIAAGKGFKRGAMSEFRRLR